MPLERAPIEVENLIADHVASSFRRNDRARSTNGAAAQIRSCITDRFPHSKIGFEQDNTPLTIPAVRNRVVTIASPPQKFTPASDHREKLALLQASLNELRRRREPHVSRKHERQLHELLHVGLLLERQKLTLKNEVTKGFGRLETWIIALVALALILLKAVPFLWGLPILAFGIGRAWYLDHRCKKRLARVAEIDAILAPVSDKPQS